LIKKELNINYGDDEENPNIDFKNYYLDLNNNINRKIKSANVKLFMVKEYIFESS
jgi:hypothetical protein